jgi:hypothetical protein
MMAGTLLWGLPTSLSHSAGVSIELLLVEEFDFDILLNFNLNGATFIALSASVLLRARSHPESGRISVESARSRY